MQSLANIRGVRAVRAETDPAQILMGQIRAGFEAFKADHNSQLTGLSDRLLELEQQRVSGAALPVGAGQNLAAQLFASQDFEAFRARRIKSAGFQVKSADLLLNVRASTITQTGREIAPYDRPAGIVGAPQRKQWLRERLSVIPVGGPGVEYTRESAFANNAAPTYSASPEAFEGVLKPESGLTFELVSARVPTIAHWVKASQQTLDDQPALQAFVDMRLRYGLELALESQIISGDGTGANMTGLATAATAYTPVTGDTGLDSISRAKAQLETANFTPDCVVLHPTDYGTMERLKDANDNYIIGQPAGALQPMLWSVPVFKSATIAAGKFLIADLASSSALFVRQDALVEMTNSNDTDFVKNLVTIRAELRAVLGVLVPAGVLYGNLTQ